MPQGLQIFNAEGELMLDVTNRITRRLGTIATASGVSGSLTVPTTSSGDLIWAAPQADYSLDALMNSRPPVVIIDQASKQISWNANLQSIRIEYGLY